MTLAQGDLEPYCVFVQGLNGGKCSLGFGCEPVGQLAVPVGVPLRPSQMASEMCELLLHGLNSATSVEEFGCTVRSYSVNLCGVFSATL